MSDHTAENDAPRCDCCDSRLVNGECPGRWIGGYGDGCVACAIQPDVTDPISSEDDEG